MSRLFARYRRVLNANQTINKRHILTKTKNETKRNETMWSEKNRTIRANTIFFFSTGFLFVFIHFVRISCLTMYAAYYVVSLPFAFKGDGWLLWSVVFCQIHWTFILSHSTDNTYTIPVSRARKNKRERERERNKNDKNMQKNETRWIVDVCMCVCECVMVA